MPKHTLIPLREFLERSGVPYHTYRRLRLLGVTPEETRLSHKVVLLSTKHLAKWQEQAALKLLKLKQQKRSSTSPR